MWTEVSVCTQTDGSGCSEASGLILMLRCEVPPRPAPPPPGGGHSSVPPGQGAPLAFPCMCHLLCFLLHDFLSFLISYFFCPLSSPHPHPRLKGKKKNSPKNPWIFRCVAHPHGPSLLCLGQSILERNLGSLSLVYFVSGSGVQRTSSLLMLALYVYFFLSVPEDLESLLSRLSR